MSIDDDRTDDDDVADLDPPELGPCCACGQAGPGVRNVLLLPYYAMQPDVPGGVWGCAICGIQGGALAVLCDACAAAGAKPYCAVDGPPKLGRRVALGMLKSGFRHDAAKHRAVGDFAVPEID